MSLALTEKTVEETEKRAVKALFRLGRSAAMTDTELFRWTIWRMHNRKRGIISEMARYYKLSRQAVHESVRTEEAKYLRFID